MLKQFNEGLDTVKIGLQLEAHNEDLKEIESYLNEEIKADNILPKDHPERVKSDALI